MGAITSIRAREVLDSRGNPTVEVELTTSSACARAIVPSGASTGRHEAIELRDGGRRWHGKGVLKAVGNVNRVLARKLKGMDVQDQEALDRRMLRLDGTPNKSRLGANAILAVSLAACRAAAQEREAELFQHIAELAGTRPVLPVPAFNIINGGKHAGNALDIQEYMLLPAGAKSFADALRIGSEAYHALKGLLIERHGKAAVNVGDEGGFAPPLTCIEEPLDLILEAVQEVGSWRQVRLGLDCAASSFWAGGTYIVEGKPLTPARLHERYLAMAGDYPLVSIEDPFHEEAFGDFARLTRALKGKVQVVGDDLTVTNPVRIRRAIKAKSCSCLLLKVNQIGTLTEALAAAKLARKAGWEVMVSHRSGETEDAFIADLAAGIGCGQLKSGAPCRGERTAKYNRLLRIEDRLGAKARYAGWKR
jgi:enolase